MQALHKYVRGGRNPLNNLGASETFSIHESNDQQLAHGTAYIPDYLDKH